EPATRARAVGRTGACTVPTIMQSTVSRSRSGRGAETAPPLAPSPSAAATPHTLPEARGHGVPKVMDAIYYQGDIIRPIVAAVKSIASAIAIGTGASVGREDPIIQIGSGLGSTLGQLIRMPAGPRIILVAARSGPGSPPLRLALSCLPSS
ncbi:MAG: chloride channel protein, partial [Steroidobacteraceae bacterium]